METCISIHLMLMLIGDADTNTTSYDNYFNTSHVNVNQSGLSHLEKIIVHFNTSHVNVNQ